MVTFVGTQKDVGSLVNQLIELDYDAVAAYEAAIHRVESEAYRFQLTRFMNDHQRHILALKPHAGRLADHVATGPDFTQIISTGRVLIANLVGDRAVLLALLSLEDDTNQAAERAVQHADVAGELLGLLQTHFEDERRHRLWLDTTLHPDRPEEEMVGRTETLTEGTGFAEPRS